MPWLGLRVSPGCRPLPSCLVVLWVLLMGAPRGACDADPTAIYQMWEEVSSLRTRGEFGRAVDVLTAITQDPSSSEGVLHHAYNHLVFTYYLMNDEGEARRAAAEALERFPDLVADPIEFPPRVAGTYDELRREMFGSLVVSEPAGAELLLDGRAAGLTPVTIPWVRVGEHDLVLRKPGHAAYAARVQVDPGGRHTFAFTLERRRDAAWWLVRAGAGVVAGALVVLALRGDEQATTEAQPLSDPPPPPGD